VILIVIEGQGDVGAADQEVAVVEIVQESVATRSLVNDINILQVVPEARLLVVPDLADLGQGVVPEIEAEDIVVGLVLGIEHDPDQDQGIEVGSTKNLKGGIEEEVQVLVLDVVAGIQNLAPLEIAKTETGVEEVMIEKVAIEGVEIEKEAKRGLAVIVKDEVKIRLKFEKGKGS